MANSPRRLNWKRKVPRKKLWHSKRELGQKTKTKKTPETNMDDETEQLRKTALGSRDSSDAEWKRFREEQSMQHDIEVAVTTRIQVNTK